MAIISRREHACSAAGECLAETAEEGGAEASTATEGQLWQWFIFYYTFLLVPSLVPRPSPFLVLWYHTEPKNKIRGGLRMRLHCTSVHNLCSRSGEFISNGSITVYIGAHHPWVKSLHRVHKLALFSNSPHNVAWVKSLHRVHKLALFSNSPHNVAWVKSLHRVHKLALFSSSPHNVAWGKAIHRVHKLALFSNSPHNVAWGKAIHKLVVPGEYHQYH